MTSDRKWRRTTVHCAKVICVLVGAFICCGLTQRAQSASLSVNPITFTFAPAQGALVLRVENADDKPVRVQVTPVLWSLRDGIEHEEETDGLLLNPPIFSIDAHKMQFVRFGLRHRDNADTEQAFRLLIEEVPDPNAPREPGLRTVLRLSVPAFVAPPKPVKHMNWTVVPVPGGAKIVGENDGNVHQRIVKLSLVTEQGNNDVITSAATYFLPGEKREWPLPSVSDLAHPLTLVVVNEQGVEERVVVSAASIR